jgi:ankyrin repeat protein
MKHLRLAALLVLFAYTTVNAQSLLEKDSLKQVNLFQIIRSGDSPKLEEQLKNGLNSNDSVDRYSLLMLAAMSGSLEEMKLLVQHGANVNYVNRDSLTALWLAVPDTPKTLFLINNGADIFATTVGGRTMLRKLALMPGSERLIRLFIAKGLIPQKNNPNNILIVNASFSADTGNLAPFLEAGLDVNSPDESGNEPIIVASGYNCYPTVRMLIEHGAKIDVSDRKYQFTPLMNAASAGDEETVNLLIDHGADIRLLDFMGYNALTWLALADIDRSDIVETMCKGLGDQLTKKGKDWSTSYSWMKKKGNNKSVQVISKYSSQQP